MPVVFSIRQNVDGISGPVIDYDIAPDQEVTAEETTAIAASEAADTLRRIEKAITGQLSELGDELARIANGLH